MDWSYAQSCRKKVSGRAFGALAMDLEWGIVKGNFNDGQRADVGIAAISRPNIIPGLRFIRKPVRVSVFLAIS